MHLNHTKLIYGALFLASAFLTACGGGGGGTTAPAATYTIGVTVNGLSGTLVLLNNGVNPLNVTADGSFNFSTAATNGTPYAVTVSSKPALQTCTVSNNSGNVSGADINLTVNCSATTYTIGGTITNLSGTVGLHISTGENLTNLSNGTYSFAPITIGSSYTVTVPTQPAGQRCTVANPTGIANANFNNVNVSCVPVYTISAAVSGLGTPPSIGLVLQNTGNNNLSISADGTLAFSKGLANGESYHVKVMIQPAAPR